MFRLGIVGLHGHPWFRQWLAICSKVPSHYTVEPLYKTTPQNGLNTLNPRQNGRLFADNIFKCIFLDENVWNRKKISLKFAPKVGINNIPSLVQIMAWRRPGDKPLSEPMDG